MLKLSQLPGYVVELHETPFQTYCSPQITFNFHIHHHIVLQVAENIAENKRFVKLPQHPNSPI